MTARIQTISPKDRELLHRLINNECTYIMQPQLIDEFIDMGRIISLRRRQRIISTGEVNDDIYIIMSGILRTWFIDGEQEVTQAFGPPGTIVQSFHSYYEGLPSSLNFEACCPARLLLIDRRDFDFLIENRPEFNRWVLRLAQRQMYHSEIKQRVINGPAREKYVAMISHLPDIINNVPLKVIATYLGITPEYLSKLRRIMIHEQQNKR